MLLSGSRSYYDEYLRKKGTGRTLHDPASLLTDRGAYVNFLEVQLERVSAACLSVQAFEERFDDLQTMLQTVEQRCASTTKLEVRAEADRKVEAALHQLHEQKTAALRSLNSLDIRLHVAEKTISHLTALEQRLSKLEQQVEEEEATRQRQQQVLAEGLQKQNNDLFELRGCLHDLDDQVSTVRSEQHHLRYLAEEEVQEKIARHLCGVDEKLQASVSSVQAVVRDHLLAQETSLAHRLEEMQGSIRRQEAVVESCEPRLQAVERVAREAQEERDDLSAEVKKLHTAQAFCHERLQGLQEEVFAHSRSVEDVYAKLVEDVEVLQRRETRTTAAVEEKHKAVRDRHRKRSSRSHRNGSSERQTSSDSSENDDSNDSENDDSDSDSDEEDAVAVDEDHLFDLSASSPSTDSRRRRRRKKTSSTSRQRDKQKDSKANKEKREKEKMEGKEKDQSEPTAQIEKRLLDFMQRYDDDQRNLRERLSSAVVSERDSRAEGSERQTAGRRPSQTSSEEVVSKAAAPVRKPSIKMSESSDNPSPPPRRRSSSQTIARKPSAVSFKEDDLFSKGEEGSKAAAVLPLSRSSSQRSLSSLPATDFQHLASALSDISSAFSQQQNEDSSSNRGKEKSTLRKIWEGPTEKAKKPMRLVKEKERERAKSKQIEEASRRSQTLSQRPPRSSSPSLLRPTVSTALRRAAAASPSSSSARRSLTPPASIEAVAVPPTNNPVAATTKDAFPDYLQKYLPVEGRHSVKKAWKVNTYSHPTRPTATQLVRTSDEKKLVKTIIDAQEENKKHVMCIAEHCTQTSDSLFDLETSTVVTTSTTMSTSPASLR
eukprot:scaffold391_cov151-Ochromonas_danica.AAC.2